MKLTGKMHRITGKTLSLALMLAGMMLGLLPVGGVQAAALKDSGVLYVNTYSDDANATSCSGAAGSNCSLRGAITKASATSGAVTIYLQEGGYGLFGESGEDGNQSGDLDISKYGGSITIVGDSLSTTTIDGRHSDRIFDVQDTGSAARLNLKNLTLINGNAGPMYDGGTIRTYGSLSLDTVAISNSAGRLGGAIYIRSSYDQKLIINRSVITNATASLDGGAVYATGEVTTISSSSFVHNAATGAMGVFFSNANAGRGGAIYNNSTLSVSASTFADNTAKVDGGGILNYAFMGQNATTSINSSTFRGNSTAVANVATANGNASTAAVTTIANSILASSTETENCVNRVDDQGRASFVNGGSNLDTGISCGFAGSAGSIFGQDPKLGTLDDYGGPTPTLALQGGSPAIDAGNPATCAMRDQRGLYASGRCDIGAYEYNAGPTLLVMAGSGKNARLQVTVVNQMGNPLVGWLVNFDPAEGSGVTLTSRAVRTNDLGVAVVYADVSGLGGSALISVHSGSGTAMFMASQGGVIPYALDGLPNTGYAPGEKTYLPAVSGSKAYQAEGDLRLDIPKLDVSLPVVGIPRAGAGWDITWLTSQAGYLQGTAFPSFEGNSVLTSHVYLADGRPGPFVKLNSLKWGDRLRLKAYGSTYVYEVRQVQVVEPDDRSVMGHREGSWLTLLTCQEYDRVAHTYLKRLAVSAVLVQTTTP